MKLSLLPPSLISFLLLSLSIGPETTTARRSSSNLSTFTLRSDPSPPSNFKRQDPYDASFPSLPSTMGMIYPDPSETLYAGQTISIGFLDPPAAQNETLAGVFRLVTPTLTYSNRTIPLVSPSYLSAPTVVLEPWGSLSMTAPPDSYYPPRPRQGWCTVTLFPRDVHVRNFLIPTGLEDDQVRFSLNVTWGLPSYVRPVLSSRQ
ncbi:hypothetical protein BDY24DRAFT_416659 [Mrakia frigida]|uniref:uncharacterized protein n=1 Tax=Mrakia frigida TaxID=29902 RepID=UPI003FCC17C1